MRVAYHCNFIRLYFILYLNRRIEKSFTIFIFISQIYSLCFSFFKFLTRYNILQSTIKISRNWGINSLESHLLRSLCFDQYYGYIYIYIYIFSLFSSIRKIDGKKIYLRILINILHVKLNKVIIKSRRMRQQTCRIKLYHKLFI